jgi:curli biogenesis system outer membrane secretion channel CsgG
MKKLSMMSAVVASVVFIGCGTEINIGEYPNSVRQPVVVPDVCKAEYESLKSIPKVAVVRFTNNSAFGKANTSSSNGSADYSHAGAAGIAVGANGIGIAEADKSHLDTHTNSTSRVVDPKLDKAISGALEGSLANMGGLKIYSRADLDKVMKEQKLQQSGLFDEKTLVKVGKLAGVKYIVTGSIDSVTQEYKDYEGAANAAGNAVAGNGQQKQESLQSMAFKAVLNLGASAASGMKVTTRATFKVIDVTTGEIVFSKQLEETKNIGKIKNPTYTQVIGAIKDDLMEELKGLKPELSKFFAPVGYITKVKTNAKHSNFIAQINLGSKDGIKPEQTFSVYQFDSVIDPVSGKTSCDKYTMNVKLTVSKNQLEPKYAWTKAEGDDAPKIRPGQIVKRDALKNSMLSF